MDDQFLSLLARSHLFTLLSIAWCWSVSTICRPTRTQILLTDDTSIHQPCPFPISRIFSRVYSTIIMRFAALASFATLLLTVTPALADGLWGLDARTDELLNREVSARGWGQ